MILQYDLIITSLVVKSEVMAQQRARFDLLSFQSQEIHLRIVLDLNLLIISHSLVLEELQSLPTAHWEVHLIDSNGRGRLLWI